MVHCSLRRRRPVPEHLLIDHLTRSPSLPQATLGADKVLSLSSVSALIRPMASNGACARAFGVRPLLALATPFKRRSASPPAACSGHLSLSRRLLLTPFFLFRSLSGNLTLTSPTEIDQKLALAAHVRDETVALIGLAKYRYLRRTYIASAELGMADPFATATAAVAASQGAAGPKAGGEA